LHLCVNSPVGSGNRIVFDVDPSLTLGEVKKRTCKLQEIAYETTILVHNGEVLYDDTHAGELGLEKYHEIGLVPNTITGSVDESALAEEYNYLREQFPLIKMVDLMTYQGRLRCERGPVKDLADKGVWPFTEYVQWHEFKMVLSFLHPYKPPNVTWLTDISHPNIIPKKKGKVCVSILGKKWLPNTKLAAVINALYFLLSDPNPYSAYPVKRCKEVAKICRMYGFPKKRHQVRR
jgi:hypothetical protein